MDNNILVFGTFDSLGVCDDISNLLSKCDICVNMNIFQPHSLKARMTFLTLAVFVICIWSLMSYASIMLREDILTHVSARQFSTVSFIAAQVNQDLNDRMKSLKKIADGVTPAMLANT